MNTKIEESDDEEGPSFREMGLDDRLLEAAAVKLAWKEPTDIQQRAIPLIMEGRDLLARGRTGSPANKSKPAPVSTIIINNFSKSFLYFSYDLQMFIFLLGNFAHHSLK